MIILFYFCSVFHSVQMIWNWSCHNIVGSPASKHQMFNYSQSGFFFQNKRKKNSKLIDVILLQVSKLVHKYNTGSEKLNGQDRWLHSWIRLGYTPPSPVRTSRSASSSLCGRSSSLPDSICNPLPFRHLVFFNKLLSLVYLLIYSFFCNISCKQILSVAFSYNRSAKTEP